MNQPKEYEVPEPTCAKKPPATSQDEIKILIDQAICGLADRYDQNVEERFAKLETFAENHTRAQQLHEQKLQEQGACLTRQIEMLVGVATQTKQTLEKMQPNTQMTYKKSNERSCKLLGKTQTLSWRRPPPLEKDKLGLTAQTDASLIRQTGRRNTRGAMSTLIIKC